MPAKKTVAESWSKASSYKKGCDGLEVGDTNKLSMSEEVEGQKQRSFAGPKSDLSRVGSSESGCIFLLTKD